MENLSRLQSLETDEDHAFLKQILATHAPNEQRIDCKSILKKAEEIFTLAMAEVTRLGGTSLDTEGSAATEEEELQEDDDNSEFAKHSDIINHLSIEIANCGGVNLHEKTLSLLSILSKYTFESKLALSIAALALNHGQYLLLIEVYLSDKIPQQMAILKGMSDIGQHSDKIKSWLDNLNLIISCLLDLAKTTVKLVELNPNCSSVYAKENSGTIPIATYWGIRGVVVSASAQVNSMDLENITSTAQQREIASFAQNIKNMKQLLEKLIIQRQLDQMKLRDSYARSVKSLDTTHFDDYKVLKVVYKIEDEPPKPLVLPEALRGKTVLLLLSGLDISEDHDFALLCDAYEESRSADTSSAENRYEVMWVPIPEHLDQWTDDMKTVFESSRAMMPWTVQDLDKIDLAVIKSTMERFHYQGQPIVAVLDTHQKEINDDAIDMMWTWGNHAFPFSKAKEETLWREEIFALDLIVNGFYAEIEKWVKEGKYIIMYGGDDVEWVSKFVTATIQATRSRNILLEMIYVGKNNQNIGKTNGSISWIENNGISHYLPNTNMIHFFWTRMEHMKRSKIRAGNSNNEEDKVLQGITKLLSYEKWGSLFKGQELISMGNGDSMLLAMKTYCEKSKENDNMSFGEAFKECFDKIKGTPIVRIFLPGTHDNPFLKRVVCTECERVMGKFIMFRCSHGSGLRYHGE